MPAKAGIPFISCDVERMEKRFWVYIVTDKPYGTLYTGVTSNIVRRAYEHKNGTYEGFSKRYKLKILVYFEEHATSFEAIQREKRIKKWNREWKINNLIHMQNREWRDLYQDIVK
jgi:putative endonuclease